MTNRKPPLTAVTIKLTPEQDEALRALAAGKGNLSSVVRDLLGQASPVFAAAEAPRQHVPAEPPAWVKARLKPGDRVELATYPSGVRYWSVTSANPEPERPLAERLAHARHEAKWRASQGLPVQADSWIARTFAEAGEALPTAGMHTAACRAATPARKETEREELTRLRAEAYAQLTDFERRDAAKISDPEARARFVASRLARKRGNH